MIGPLARLFQGELRAYGLSVVTDPARAPGTIAFDYPLHRLLQEPITLLALLQRHADHYGTSPTGQPPRRHLRAAASMWSKHYFAALLPAYVGTNCVLRWALPVDPADCRVLLDADAHPIALCLSHAGSDVAGLPARERYEALVWRHLDPLVRAMAAAAGLAPRLLWNNAAVLVDDILRGVAAHGARGAADEDANLLLRQAHWDGRPNPMAHPTLPDTEGQAGKPGRPLRRLCCLRYFLPEHPYCGNCPLPQARRSH